MRILYVLISAGISIKRISLVVTVEALCIKKQTDDIKRYVAGCQYMSVDILQTQDMNNISLNCTIIQSHLQIKKGPGRTE